jgi:DNA-binding NarL/FixJ family response regulator
MVVLDTKLSPGIIACQKVENSRTILLADDQFLITEALQKILSETGDFSIAGVLQSAFELEKYIQNNPPDVLIIELSILTLKGIQYLGEIKANHPGTAIVVLSNRISSNEISTLNKTGINNILYKTAEKHEIIEAIHAAMQGKKYYSTEIVDMLLEAREKRDNHAEASHLTGAEKDIVVLIARGLTTKEIAREKNISFHTVNTHRKNIFRKLGINNVSELMMFAMKNGIIDAIDYYI